jgi:hypothetical protein
MTTRSSSGREFSAETLQPRKVTSDATKTHFAGLIRIPYLSSWSKRVRRCCSCSSRERENEDAIQVSETEVEFPQCIVYEALKCLCGVA